MFFFLDVSVSINMGVYIQNIIWILYEFYAYTDRETIQYPDISSWIY
jgi:hypothetical protein